VIVRVMVSTSHPVLQVGHDAGTVAVPVGVTRQFGLVQGTVITSSFTIMQSGAGGHVAGMRGQFSAKILAHEAVADLWNFAYLFQCM
jgi:hypothetical protein